MSAALLGVNCASRLMCALEVLEAPFEGVFGHTRLVKSGQALLSYSLLSRCVVEQKTKVYDLAM